MTPIIIYLSKVLIIHGLMYLFYFLVLRKSGRHIFNRFYLMGTLVISFIIPTISIHLPYQVVELQNDDVLTWIDEPGFYLEDLELIPIKEETTISIWQVLVGFYGTITCFFLLRSFFYLSVLHRVKRQARYVKKYWFKLFKTSHTHPFSFFYNVFIPEPLFKEKGFKKILAHECVHAKQLHSFDRLLLDFVVSLFWFNPFIYLYRNALIEIHEYLADEEVLKRYKDPVEYQEVLFSQLTAERYAGLVSHFNVQLTKKRIVMMNKQNKMSHWVNLLAIPVVLIIVFAFSSKEMLNPIHKVGNELSTLLGPAGDPALPEFNWVQEVGQYEPSLLPLRNYENIRMSSGFGMRTNPLNRKERHWHGGLDFMCKTGTEVIATASGKVVKVKDSEGGYGKHIVIDHNGQYETKYAHLSAFKVKVGDMVTKGDLIGLSGNSGKSTKAHIHYEVEQIGKGKVDPKKYITNYEIK